MAAATHQLIGVVGDSGSGKTTLSQAIASLLGPGRTTLICLDDYHRYDRAERERRAITALDPECNRLDLMADHLAALRRGRAVTKPVYNHQHGTFDPDEVVEPRPVVIARGLLGLHDDRLAGAFDLSIFLDPDPALRVRWKVARDCAKRGYTPEQVLAQIARRQRDVERYIAPQRLRADLVIRLVPRAALDGRAAEAALDMHVYRRGGKPTASGRGASALVETVLQAADSVRNLRSSTSPSAPVAVSPSPSP
jgi:phosphoribulokinase